MVSKARAQLSEAAVWAALAEVPDPEIPLVSIVDLGIVRSVRVLPDVAAASAARAPGAMPSADAVNGITDVADAGERITVELLPTFVGCPALDVLRAAAMERLQALAPAAAVSVEFTFREPWTTERITRAGRAGLRRSGFAPPARGDAHGRAAGVQGSAHGSLRASVELPLVQLDPAVRCPHCGSRRTRLESPFGPALCRAVYHCSACRQPFEAFKAV